MYDVTNLAFFNLSKRTQNEPKTNPKRTQNEPKTKPIRTQINPIYPYLMGWICPLGGGFRPRFACPGADHFQRDGRF